MKAGMMTRWMLAAGAALVVAAPVAAQSTFPTRAAGVRAGGQVLLICDATASNCAPAGPTNAVPVTAMGGGPTSSATSQSVVPATDSPPFPVGGVYTSSLPTLTNNQRSSLQLDGAGRLIVKIGDARFARSGFANGFNQFSSFNLFADDGGSGPLNVVMTYQDPASGNGFTARGDTSGLFVGANQFWTESSAALAASAPLNGALRVNGGTAGGTGSRFAFFIAEAFSDVAGGTLFVDKTVDGGTTYRQVGSVALVANSSVTLKVPVSAAGYRARVVNGGTAQGAALVTTAYSLN